MNSDAFEFTPRWASPPGATLNDILNERQQSPELMAETMDVTLDAVHGLLTGQTPVTVGLARKLALHVGSTVEFWLTRDVQYREDMNRVEINRWAASLPIKQMVSLGWIGKSSDWKERLSACLQFFDVSNYAEWQGRYQPILRSAYFRLSPAYAKEPAILAWLRQGEIVTQGHLGTSWNPDHFRAVLMRARPLTREMNPARFIPALTSMCAEAGVKFAVLRAPEGCPVSGVARFGDNANPTIVLSARYLADDHFWFSFFHEAGHLLLHSSGLHVDDEREFKGGPSVSPAEREANQFAERVLIPSGIERFRSRRHSGRELVEVARGLGIGPGVLVGQLQHSGAIGYGAFNGLKRRYKWVGVNLERA